MNDAYDTLSTTDFAAFTVPEFLGLTGTNVIFVVDAVSVYVAGAIKSDSQ